MCELIKKTLGNSIGIKEERKVLITVCNAKEFLLKKKEKLLEFVGINKFILENSEEIRNT